MKNLPFTKMHGVGNDFIVVEKKDLTKNNIQLSKELIYKMCASHVGIGADGVIIISKGKKNFIYEMYNYKGVPIKMSGNGIRCYMRYLYIKGLIKTTETKIETLVGDMALSINKNLITVDMGKAYKMKNFAYGNKVLGDRFPIKVNKEEFIFYPVGIGGTPNAVIFLKDLDLKKINLTIYGTAIAEAIDIFKNRTNVEFIKIVSSTEINMRAWGRKSGETQACGIGACAAVVTGIISGKLESDIFIRVNVNGGVLEIKWSGNIKDSIIIKGEAKEVFEGNYYITNEI